MSDISDPSGAGRGDRRRARRMVDEAYAEGRITAADRALRLEQIDAASTKGDLAMVLRDLESRPPTATSPDLGAPPFGMPPPVADLDPVAPRDLPGPPPSTAPPPSTGARPGWAPPSYGGSGSGAATGTRPGGWTTERTIGCGVIAVIAIFVVPLIVAIVVFVGVAGSIDGFDSGSSDDLGFADDGYTEKDGVTVPDAATWWDLQVADLDDDAGAATVTTYDVRDGSGTATVVDGATSRQWVFRGVEWAPVGEPTGLDPEASPVDLTEVAPSVIQDVVESTLLEVGPDASPDVQLHVVTSSDEPRLVVDVTDGSTTTRGTFALDGTPID